METNFLFEQAWSCWFNQSASLPFERMLTGILECQDQGGTRALKDAPQFPFSSSLHGSMKPEPTTEILPSLQVDDINHLRVRAIALPYNQSHRACQCSIINRLSWLAMKSIHFDVDTMLLGILSDLIVLIKYIQDIRRNNLCIVWSLILKSKLK